MANTLITPTVIPSAFCSNGDKNTILASPSTSSPQLANYSTGFPAITQTPIPNGGIPPERADFNGLFNMLSSALFFQQNGGKWTFVPEVSQAIGGYPKGAILSYANSTDGTVRTVVSNINNNVNNFLLDPSQIGDSSKPWSYTESISIAQNLTNPSENTVPSTKAVSDESTRIINFVDNNFVNNTKLQVVTELPKNPISDVFYYVPDDSLPQQMTNYDYVVDYKTPTDADPTWYRVYKSGWVEQGGILPKKDNWSAVTITFPKPFANTLYTVLTSTGYTTNTDANTITGKTITTFTTTGYNSTGFAGWQASGQGA